MSCFKVQSGQKVVLIGDSITDCGRRDSFPPFGNGYVSMVVNLVTAKYPERSVEWVNRGISGDTVQGLVDRWTADVIKEAPNWVSIAIGINNVARDQASNRSIKDILSDFENSYRAILNRIERETDAKPVMFEIFYVAEDAPHQNGLKIDPYNEIIHRLAAEYKAPLVPVNSAFKQAVSKRPGYAWTTGDGVHPLPVGHALMALTFLETLEW